MNFLQYIKSLLYLMMDSGLSTMVKHQPHHHKVKGLCPTLAGTWREICERERSGLEITKLCTEPVPLVSVPWLRHLNDFPCSY